jgi:hypothetical protein
VQRLRAAGGGARAQPFGDRLHVWSEPADATAAAAWFADLARRAGIAPIGVRSIAPSLEDVFIARLDTASRPQDLKATGPQDLS